ncbi:uncharacterized protein LOC133777560 [Humulus lupulus]|uniref:uncharacterized protein LOC133777560 n=1 Tax=Humulus lupulus TaxID=3486 RepID=UPI002B4122C7|nr:uncharacterized protein LOC133777560 [Humulus lupulus]
MVPELDLKPKLEASMKVSFHKDNITTIQQDPDDSFLPCLSNYKDDIFDMEESPAQQTTVLNGSDNEELDIIGDTCSCDNGLVESDCADVIESSSSFGDSVSEKENCPKLDGDEVQSRLCGDPASISVYDEYYDAFQFRKKKMTPHWRMYIRPIMWRCKWMELKIKELQSQAMKYDRELAKYDDRKQREFETFTSEGFGSKSLPFPSQIQRNKVMKRKKRKRVEQTIDLVPYMSQHNLFSYYESKMSVPVSAPMEDISGAVGKASYHNDEFGTTSSFEFQDGDDLHEAILLDIEKLHLRVQKLIPRVKKMVSENSEKISYINKLNIVAPCNRLVSSAQNAVPPENGNGLRLGSLHTSERNMGDLLMLESAVSSHGEGTPHSEMTESTNHFQIGGLYGSTEDEVLIDNEQAKEELHDFKKLRDQLAEKPEGSIGEQKTIPTLQVSEADLLLKAGVRNVKSNGKKRYRGKRKAKAGSRR